MRGFALSVFVSTTAGIGPASAWSSHCPLASLSGRATPTSWRVHASASSRERERAPAEDDAEAPPHPHSLLWSTTLARAPNACVHPAVALTVRPPSAGGTGIVAGGDLDAGTVALRLPLEEVGMLDAASVLDAYETAGGDDAVLDALRDMWRREPEGSEPSKGEEGTRLAVLAG